MCDDEIVQDESTKIIEDITPYHMTTKGLGYEFFNAMKRYKDRVAQYIAETDYTDTYESFLQRAIRTALYLKERNLTSEDVVCCSSYNQLHSAVPVVACLFLGIPVTSLDPSLTKSEVTHAIKLVKPKFFFIVPEILDIIQDSIKTLAMEAEIVIYGDHEYPLENISSFNNFLTPHPDEETFSPVEIDDITCTAVIFLSSGSTGLPKAICISHKAIFYQANLINVAFSYRPKNQEIKSSVRLLFSNFYWISAVLNLASCILGGNTRLVCKKFDAVDLWKNIEKYKVNFAFLIPVQAYEMIAAGRPEGIDTSSLHIVATGGVQFSLEKLYELRELLPDTLVYQTYGCTEVSGPAAIFNLSRIKDRSLLNSRPKSVGGPMPGYKYKVVDLETEANLGPNQLGELRIISEFTMMAGYYQQDSSSEFDSDGWFKTGDIVYYDEDYYFYIVDRVKEMLKYRNWQVPPALVEGVLQNHPAVNQCVVVGTPHKIDGDLPCAIIVLNKDHQGKVTKEEIEDFVAERVNDTHRLRGGVNFIEALPLTPSGKFRRKQIKDMVLNGEI